MRIAVLILALSATTAAAEPPGLTPLVEPAAPPPSEPLEASYRAQTAGADAAALGLVFVAAGTKSGGVSQLALGTYMFGAPLVHLAHHRPGRAAGSLALRVGLPILGGVIGAKTYHSSCRASDDTCDDDEGPIIQAALGILGGMIAASVIDTAVLAKGDEAPARPGWSPTVRANHDGFSLGVTGSF